MAITIKNEWPENSKLFLKVSGVGEKMVERGGSWTFQPPESVSTIDLGRSFFLAKDNLAYTLKIEVGIGASDDD